MNENEQEHQTLFLARLTSLKRVPTWDNGGRNDPYFLSL